MIADERLDALRRRVLNVVGHELRTPVTTLRGLAEVLAAAEDDALVRAQVVPALVRTARRLEQLVDDVLVASGVTTALPVGRPVAARASEVARQAWDELARPCALELVGDADARVSAPPTSAQRALVHLLRNAAQYGRPPVRVEVEPAGEMTRIVVESAGDVIPEADLALAFEPFYRGERAVTLAAGLGVGLAVAKTLTEHAGGCVSLRRREGGGIVATLELPRG